MAKKLEGWKRGQGVYSQVSDGKDRIVQGNRGDLPVGVGTYELDIEKVMEETRGRLRKDAR